MQRLMLVDRALLQKDVFGFIFHTRVITIEVDEIRRSNQLELHNK